MYSAFYCCGAAADLFLSIMLWFILDEDKPLILVLDGDRTYGVIDVIDARNSVNNVGCDEVEEEE